MVPGIGREQWKAIPGQYGVSIGDNKNILELDNGDVYIILNIYQSTVLCTLKEWMLRCFNKNVRETS